MENPWNSLEVAKLIISCLTPIVGGIIAWRLARLSKEVENKQWTDRKIIEKRLEIYDRVVPQLNDLYCFYNRIGNWKAFSPEDILRFKRSLDKDFHVNSHLFQTEILADYNNLIDVCFTTHTGEKTSAKIIADAQKRERLSDNWKTEWNKYFVPNSKVKKEEIKKYYQRLINVFRYELGLKA